MGLARRRSDAGWRNLEQSGLARIWKPIPRQGEYGFGNRSRRLVAPEHLEACMP